MNQTKSKIGLVLSGGGAKGAYHVGVIKYLAEAGMPINAISGASIGALNGALISSSSSINEASIRLQELWGSLASHNPIKLKEPSYEDFAIYLAGLLVSAGGAGLIKHLGLVNKFIADGVCDDKYIKSLIREYTSPQTLNKGIPLYVSVYHRESGIISLFESMMAAIGVNNTKPSDFIHIQSLPLDTQQDAVFASSSLPLLYRSHKINNKSYLDGGIGGWDKAQGNTPITPLIQYENCTHILVIHLSNGSLWNRHDFNTATVLEIRPKQNVGNQGMIRSLLDFSQDKINYLIDQGYEDAHRCIGNVLKVLHTRYASEIIIGKMSESLDKLDQDGFSLDNFNGYS